MRPLGLLSFQKYISASLICLTISGCFKPTINPRNISSAPGLDPAVYTIQEYQADKAIYDTDVKPGSLDLDNAKLQRNEIVFGLMTDIEIVYNKYYRELFGGKNTVATVGDGIVLGLTAGGAITTNVATKTILAALGTAFSGLNLSISKNFYAEQSFQVIGVAMQTRRDKIRVAILAHVTQEVASYPLSEAKRDLMAYMQAGTLAAGLQELQEDAGVATSQVTLPTAAPSAPPSVTAFAGLNDNVLTWTPVSGATSYNIYYSTDKNVSTSSTKSNQAQPPFTDTQARSAEAVFYGVTAVNSIGESPISAVVNATAVTPPAAAGAAATAPSNVTVQMLGGSAVISWAAQANDASFIVYKDATSTPSTAHQISKGSVNTYTYSGADATKSYYSVVAVDFGGTASALPAAGVGSTVATPVETPLHLTTPH